MRVDATFTCVLEECREDFTASGDALVVRLDGPFRNVGLLILMLSSSDEGAPRLALAVPLFGDRERRDADPSVLPFLDRGRTGLGLGDTSMESPGLVLLLLGIASGGAEL